MLSLMPRKTCQERLYKLYEFRTDRTAAPFLDFCAQKICLENHAPCCCSSSSKIVSPLSRKPCKLLYEFFASVNVPMKLCCMDFQCWEVCPLVVRICCAAFAALPLLRNYSSVFSPPLSICS